VFPYLVDLGFRTLPLVGKVHVAIPTYGVLVALAILVAWTWYLGNARADGIDPDAAAGVAFWFLLAARLRRLPAWQLVDAAAVPLPVAQAIGRLGCLAAGCCFGGRCDLPWGIVYRSATAHERTGVPLGVPLHPAPLYEALGNVLLVLPLLLLVRRRRRVPGEVFLAWATGYGVLRFLVEFTRGDRVRGLWFGGTLSTSQLISLAVVPAAATAWVFLRRRARRAGERREGGT